MNRYLILFFLIILINPCVAQQSKILEITGLQEPVEVIRDTYGINHIYAKNEHDLFFAQGYCAVRDRLFQFELWRRQATGTVSEILGEREIKRDIGTRLFKFRANMEQELNHYHPRGADIIKAYTNGINAFIEQTEKDNSLLTLEFKLLGIKPGKWTPEVVISRHQGLLGNIREELEIGRAVAALGEDKVKDMQQFEPGDPDLSIDPSVQKDRLADDVIGVYNAFRRPVQFTPKDLLSSSNKDWKEYYNLALQDEQTFTELNANHDKIIGSNNWIVSGALTQSGFPMLANDPHRAVVSPSLRYMVHLNAPGWNVVGGGEPTIPGVSIGHNEHGAWGLTVFEIDGEDLYVYELNPDNPNQYKYLGAWENMKTIVDTIHVKGAPDVYVTHKYTRHGPVTFVDTKNNIGYAMRCAWLEPGGAPYLASLRMDQTTSWEEFREACSYSHIPAENMIWAGREGNIGWQVVGRAPLRTNWSGMVPVPGDGRYEWSGFLPIKELPHVENPEKGFWATANENLVPENYSHRNAVGWLWADPYRVNRINEVLGAGKKFSVVDMMSLQYDYTSLPARTLIPLLASLSSPDPKIEDIRKRLLKWNFQLDKNSIEAAIYMAWEKSIRQNIIPYFIPEKDRVHAPSLYLSKIIFWISSAAPEFGKEPKKNRDAFLLKSLSDAIKALEQKIGEDQSQWQYGQPDYHHALIRHPLSNAVDSLTRKMLEVGPVARGGSGSTPGATGNGDNQTSGATFRMVVDLSDWDKSMFTNAPGQSGDPESPFYKNLFDQWATDKHFPVYFSRDMIEKSVSEKTLLKPAVK